MPLHFLFFFCAFAFLAVCFCWWISRRPSCDVTVAGVVRAHVLLGRLYFILLLGKFKALFPTIAGSSCEVNPLCRLNFVFSKERSGGPSSSLCVFSCLSFERHPAPVGPSYDLALLLDSRCSFLQQALPLPDQLPVVSLLLPQMPPHLCWNFFVLDCRGGFIGLVIFRTLFR